MIIEGNIIKMRTLLSSPVNYYLQFSGNEIYMNDLIGKKIRLKSLNQIHCISCGNKTAKSFGQGFCYPCFISVPEAAPCILKPELCEAHLGIARDLEWSKNNCLTDHYVYLAITASIKVGVTRASQIPNRWIDQGAVKAIKFAKTPNRYLAGVIEKELMKYISDKTAWQKMLKNEIDSNIDLLKEKHQLKNSISKKYQEYYMYDEDITEIEFPVMYYPVKIKSIDIDKIIEFQDVLIGIKGQYLIFKDGDVINIRKYNGYKCELSF